MTLHYQNIPAIARMLRGGSLTSVDLTRHILDRIEKHKNLNAFVTVTEEIALHQAQTADAELARGMERGPLQGIPVAIKDIFATKGVRTTCGSLLFENWVPDHDAAAVSKLFEAGAVMVGKTGMHELAAGTTGHNPYFGDIENPWKRGYDPGGSSGGSACAVAAGLAFAALGTDTGCSVREPAHCCGITGFKPTFGRVSKSGVQPLAWTLDHVGVLTRTAEDAATVLDAISGFDPTDPYSVATPASRTEDPPVALGGCRIGIVRRFFFECDPDIISGIDGAIAQLRGFGAEIVELDIADIEIAFEATTTTFSEGDVIFEEDIANSPEKFSAELQKRFASQLQQPAAEYIKAQHQRASFRQRIEAIFADVQFLIAPTSRHVAASLSALPDGYEDDVWKNTSVFNFTGHPSISVPCGFTASGLPIGMMVTGKLNRDHQVLGFASLYQSSTDWHVMHPNL